MGPGGSGRERLQRRGAVLAEIRDDPRQRQFSSAVDHYARSGQQRTARAIGAVYGAQGAANQLRVGQRAIAAHQARNVVRAGRPHKRVGIGPASIDVTSGGRSVIGATSLNTGDIGPRQAFGKVSSDLGTLGAGVFVGGYEVSRGVLEAARDIPGVDAALKAVPGLSVLRPLEPLVGKEEGTARLERVGKGVVKGFRESSPAALVTGHPGLAAKRLGEHPLLEALNYAGAASVAGRTGGAIARGLGSTPQGRRAAREPCSYRVDCPSAAGDG